MFQSPAILNSVSYTKDGGVRIGFLTQELDADSKVAITEYYQQFGHVLFKPNEFTVEDIPAEDAEGKYKSKAQHLRAVLYRYWQTIGEPDTFDVWYQQQMDMLIDTFKRRLEEISK